MITSYRHPSRLALRAAVFAIAAFIAAGCASTVSDLSPGPTVTVVGDQRGGRIEHGVNDTPAGVKAAVAHCTQFGKKAQLTRMDAPSQGGLMAFECR